MADSPKPPLTIIAHKHGDTWLAYFKDKPYQCTGGQSKAEAIGKLILKNEEEAGIKIKTVM